MEIQTNARPSVALLVACILAFIGFVSVFNTDQSQNMTSLIKNSFDSFSSIASLSINKAPKVSDGTPGKSNNTAESSNNTPETPSNIPEVPKEGDPEKPNTTPEVSKEVNSKSVDKKFKKVSTLDLEGTSAFLQNGGIIGINNVRGALLCRLNITRDCKSQYIAEQIDLVYAFCPIYADHQEKQALLYTLHENFLAYLKTIGISTITLEAIYPGQQFKITRPDNEPQEIQLKIFDTFYYRENLLNVAIKKTPGWEYAIWIDAHQIFLNTYWWEEAIYKMEHYNNVQFFQTLAWLTEKTNRTDRSQDLHGVQYAYTTTRDLNNYKYPPTNMWNGNAVGIRKEIYEGLGYILDECIAGCCDCAFNIAGMKHYWDRVDKFGRYGQQLHPWIEKARGVFKTKVAVVRGSMYHFYHDHFFPWERYLNALAVSPLKLNEELYRDENFTLHIKDNSPLLQIFYRN